MAKRQELLDEHGEVVEIRFMPSTLAPMSPSVVRGSIVPAPTWEEQMPLVRVPSPPLLDASLGARRRRTFLAKWFKAAVVSRFGEKAKGASAGFARSAKVEKLLDEAAAKFVEHEIAPAAWAAWCCDLKLRFAESDDDATPPTIWSTFGASFIERRRGWFRHESDTFGGRVIFTPAHRELMRRWDAMNAELIKAGAIVDDPDRQGPIVAQHFPGDLHSELMNATHAQAAKLQTLYDQLARSGDKWLW